MHRVSGNENTVPTGARGLSGLIQAAFLPKLQASFGTQWK